MIVSFWIFPILYLVIYYGKKWSIKGNVGKIVGFLGKASYHVFCVQMMWFSIVSYVNKYVLYVFPQWMRVVITLVICLACGSLFYYVEQWLFKKFK